MYRALIKPHIFRPVSAQASQALRASVHGQAHPKVTATEDFYVSTTLPDDFDSSPMSDELLKQTKSGSGGSFDHLTKEEHFEIIYDSINPKDPKNAGKEKMNMKDPLQEPGLDEM